MKKKQPLWAKIFIGMGLGILLGLVSVWLGWEKFAIDWIKPWGIIFLKLLKLIAVPLVFISLVKGISSLTDLSRLSRIAYKTIAIYILTTLLATMLGLAVVNILKPGNVIADNKKEAFHQKFEGKIELSQESAEKAEKHSPLYFLVEMVPENIFRATGNNSKMLQTIFCAILFGVALVLVPSEKSHGVKEFFDGLNEVILKIVDLIMRFAPIGVLALMTALVVDYAGDMAVFTALGFYMLTVVLGLLLLIFGLYPLLIKWFTKISVPSFLKGILPAQLVAFTTSSSAAALPVTLKQVTNELKVPKPIAHFVLPIGVTINMDGTSCYQAISAVFIAQVFGIDLTLTQQLTIVLTATLSSIGTPGIPGGSIVMLIIVLNSVGIPVEGLALILGVERPLDMLRTVVNITGDSTVASIVAHSEEKVSIESNHRGF